MTEENEEVMQLCVAMLAELDLPKGCSAIIITPEELIVRADSIHPNEILKVVKEMLEDSTDIDEECAHHASLH